MLSDQIKKYRIRQTMTQEHLAIRAKMTYATLIKLESGANTNPTLKTLRKLSKALSIPIANLIT